MDRETVEEVKRHFGVGSEQLRSDVRAMAEGQQALQAEMRLELSTARTELARESEETRALARLPTQVDRCVRGLETEVAELRARLERVEGRLAS